MYVYGDVRGSPFYESYGQLNAGGRAWSTRLVAVDGEETLLAGELKERLEDRVLVRVAVVVVDDVD